MPTYAHFFETMEEFGFFEHIYEHLPEGFTAMFEIARVLEDESHRLTQQLLPALKLQSSAFLFDPKQQTPDPETYLPTGEEYEAQLLRSVQDVPRIYTYQFLLPDEIFYRKVAERTLWVPFAKEPTYLRVPSEVEDFNPDSRKQKVYILLDTSSSMGVKNRINLAKAIVYYFLKHNLKELGNISLRTFDTKIGELHIAKDSQSFHALISFVMRLHTLGNGTAMAKAIMQAVGDIRGLPQFSGTEILIITDGACTFNEQEMRGLLRDDIKINTVKIGKSQLFASRTYIDDALAKDDTPKRRALNNLRRTEANLIHDLAQTTSPSHKHKIESSLKYVREEISKQHEDLSAEVLAQFGHELERLSSVYINVDDVASQSVFDIDQHRVDEIEALVTQIESELSDAFTIENLKKLALLNDHIALLLKFLKDERIKKTLTSMEKRIDALLKDAVEKRLLSIDSSFRETFTTEDRHDIQFLLEHGMAVNISFWKIFILKFIARLHRILRRRTYQAHM